MTSQPKLFAELREIVENLQKLESSVLNPTPFLLAINPPNPWPDLMTADEQDVISIDAARTTIEVLIQERPRFTRVAFRLNLPYGKVVVFEGLAESFIALFDAVVKLKLRGIDTGNTSFTEER